MEQAPAAHTAANRGSLAMTATACLPASSAGRRQDPPLARVPCSGRLMLATGTQRTCRSPLKSLRCCRSQPCLAATAATSIWPGLTASGGGAAAGAAAPLPLPGCPAAASTGCPALYRWCLAARALRDWLLGGRLRPVGLAADGETEKRHCIVASAGTVRGVVHTMSWASWLRARSSANEESRGSRLGECGAQPKHGLSRRLGYRDQERESEASPCLRSPR